MKLLLCVMSVLVGVATSAVAVPAMPPAAAPSIRVVVPSESTQLYINGSSTTQTGTERVFFYPTTGLDPLKLYHYDVTAVVPTQEGTKESTLQVAFPPGETVLVKFTLAQNSSGTLSLGGNYSYLGDPSRYEIYGAGFSASPFTFGSSPPISSPGPETHYALPSGGAFSNPSFPSNFPYYYGYSYPYFDPYVYPYYGNGFSH